MLYRRYPEFAGVVHTNSVNTVAFAQAGMPISVVGTTHTDYFYGDIPCKRELAKEEVNTAYELNTVKVIIETIEKLNINLMAVPGIIVKNHEPFVWRTHTAKYCL